MKKDDRRGGGSVAFTLIELLVVIVIIAILAGLLLPIFGSSRNIAWEVQCGSNLRQICYALNMYANEYDGFFPVFPNDLDERHEHNPHKRLLEVLGAYEALGAGLLEAFYCPQASLMQKAADDTSCPPKGTTDRITDTPQNRADGYVSYVYWSFTKNKPGWRGAPFFPRVLKAGDSEWQSDDKIVYQTGADKQMLPETWYQHSSVAPGADGYFADRAKTVPPSRRWLLSDFFRRGAPIFPHARKHAGGLNVLFVDGHVELVMGRPRDGYQ